MAIAVSCPSCGRQYNVKDEAAGKRFKCKDCGGVVDVPDGNSGAGGFEDDFGDLGEFEQDPFVPGAPAPVRQGRARSAANSAAAGRVKLPAIFMYVVCGLSILNSLYSIASQAAGFQGPMPQFADPRQQQIMEMMQGMGYVVSILYLLRDVFLIFAYSQMQMLRSYGFALAGAIISVIPCFGSPCCILGIPFGIWSLVVLNDPAVKAAFR